MRYEAYQGHSNAVMKAVFILSISAMAADSGQATSDEVSTFIGKWHGQSTCVSKNTACRDETVAYSVARVDDSSDHISISADKIVSGKAVSMGTLDFQFDPELRMLICRYSQGVWRLTVDHGEMEGTLTRPDNTVLRRVRLRREP